MYYYIMKRAIHSPKTLGISEKKRIIGKIYRKILDNTVIII